MTQDTYLLCNIIEHLHVFGKRLIWKVGCTAPMPAKQSTSGEFLCVVRVQKHWLYPVATRHAGLRPGQPDHPGAAQPEVDRGLPGQEPLQRHSILCHRTHAFPRTSGL